MKIAENFSFTPHKALGPAPEMPLPLETLHSYGNQELRHLLFQFIRRAKPHKFSLTSLY